MSAEEKSPSLDEATENAAVEVDEVVVEASTNDAVTELEKQVNKANEKIAALSEQVLRTKADQENAARRARLDVEKAHKFALDKFVEELLPLIDSLELGLSAAKEETATIEKMLEGTELTYKMFIGVMEKFNVVPVNPEGEKFNPDLHQAMSTITNDEVEENTVLTVFQKGYRLNDRLVRPALVVVSKSSGEQKNHKKIDETA